MILVPWFLWSLMGHGAVEPIHDYSTREECMAAKAEYATAAAKNVSGYKVEIYHNPKTAESDITRWDSDRYGRVVVRFWCSPIRPSP